jgi:hypothetical protein
MGNFYTNYTLKGPGHQAVASALAGRQTIVTPNYNGCVTVFDEQSEHLDQAIISDLAERLSSQFDCPLLVVINHDDAILWLQLYVSGKLSDEYDSTPGYFEGGEESVPTGGDAKRLCSVFASGDASAVESILRKSFFDEGGYVFASQRHADLVGALGLPEIGVCNSYRSFDDPDFAFPGGLTRDDFVRTT